MELYLAEAQQDIEKVYNLDLNTPSDILLASRGRWDNGLGLRGRSIVRDPLLEGLASC